MKSFGNYLKNRWRCAAFFCLLAGLLTASFALYKLPLAAVAYPCALGALLGMGFLAADYRASRARRRVLRGLKGTPAPQLEELPPVPEEEAEDYREIIRELCRQQRESRAKSEADYAAMMDYYTLWAHQIKTPISSMRLQLQNEDSSSARSLLLDLGRVEGYVDMVLTYLRLDSPSTDYVIRDCDLDAIVRPAVKKFAGEFISRGLKLDYVPLECSVLTDEKWLGFVVEQLLSNALKYTPSGGIAIRLEEPRTLCIRDTGVGIDPADLPRIFEKGYTGFRGREDRRASGLGLYLCKRICGNLGHAISAESAPGEGTAVRIDLDTRKLETE